MSEINKDKLIADLRSREEERILRENELMRELSDLNRWYQSLMGAGGGNF